MLTPIIVPILMMLWGLPAITLIWVTGSETLKKLTALYYCVAFCYLAWAITKMVLGY